MPNAESLILKLTKYILKVYKTKQTRPFFPFFVSSHQVFFKVYLFGINYQSGIRNCRLFSNSLCSNENNPCSCVTFCASIPAYTLSCLIVGWEGFYFRINFVTCPVYNTQNESWATKFLHLETQQNFAQQNSETLKRDFWKMNLVSPQLFQGSITLTLQNLWCWVEKSLTTFLDYYFLNFQGITKSKTEFCRECFSKVQAYLKTKNYFK